MLAATKTNDSVSCPRCQGSCLFEFADGSAERPCRWCDGSGETTELHAAEYEIDELRDRLKRTQETLLKAQADLRIAQPVFEASKRWLTAPDGAQDFARVVIHAVAEEALLRSQVEKAGGETKAWVALMARAS